MLSRLFLVMGVAPVLAPTIGGELLRFTSWRGVFAAARRLRRARARPRLRSALRETLPPGAPAQRRASAARCAATAGCSATARYVGLILVAGLTMAALFTYVSGSSFVYQGEFGLDEQQFGLLFGAGAFWLIAATQLNPLLLRRWSPAADAGRRDGGRRRRPAPRWSCSPRTGTGGLPAVAVLAVGRALRRRARAAERPGAGPVAARRRGRHRGRAARRRPVRRRRARVAARGPAGQRRGRHGRSSSWRRWLLAVVVLVAVVRPWQLSVPDDLDAPAPVH